MLCPAVVAAAFLLLPAATGAQGAWEGYSDYESLRQQIHDLERSPHAHARSLTTTLGGRQVLLLTIGEGEVDHKPALLIIGSAHPPHLLGGELAMRLARFLVSDEDPADDLRRRFTFYVLPRPSPDASETFFHRPFTERATNLRPVDDDHDSELDEDGPDDLNGDGFITMMRIEEPGGPWIEHPQDPRVLVKADAAKGEQGRYTLHIEGRDDDGDEQFNEDRPGGVAFDRNFTFDYPYFEPAAGPHQVSEAETRAVADFAFDHPNIAVVLSFGMNDNLARPWKPDTKAEQQRIKTTLLSEDAPYYDLLAERYKELHGVKDAPASGDGRGALVKWAYFHFGRWAFETRAWWPAAAKADDGEAKDTDKRGEEELRALRWFDEKEIDAFAPWTRIEHPDLPDKVVEIGGIKPFYLLNPPAGQIESLAEIHTTFVVELVQRLPRLEVSQIKVEPLGGDVQRVTATFRNTGFLPTMSAMGRTGGAVYPLNVTLELPDGASLVTGHPRTQIAPITGGGQAEHTWLVRGRGSIIVTITSPSVGRASHSAELP